MFWKRQRAVWPVDPAKVGFGSVVAGKNLSRTHVRVRYVGKSRWQDVPFAEFVRKTNTSLRDGKALNVEHLLVAPMLKQRYAVFFDRLTDWGPASRRALAGSPRRRARLVDAS